MSQIPIIDLLSLSLEYQEEAYRASLIRAIETPEKAVLVGFKINSRVRDAVDSFILWGYQSDFYLAV